VRRVLSAFSDRPNMDVARESTKATVSDDDGAVAVNPELGSGAASALLDVSFFPVQFRFCACWACWACVCWRA